MVPGYDSSVRGKAMRTDWLQFKRPVRSEVQVRRGLGVRSHAAVVVETHALGIVVVA
jgi:hypothetical protein